MLRTLRVLLIKDLLAEARGKEILTASIIFALLFLFLLYFALPISSSPIESTNGAFWVVVFFASTLAFSRSFAKERDTGSLETLLLAPVDRSLVFISKTLSNLIFVAVVIAVALPSFAIFYNFSFLPVLFPFLGIVATTTIGLVAAGTFMGALTMQSRAREMLLLLLLFPLLIPLFMGAVNATGELLQSGGNENATTWRWIFFFFDLFLPALMILLFDFLVEE